MNDVAINEHRNAIALPTNDARKEQANERQHPDI